VTDPRVLASTRLVVGPNASLSDVQALGFFAGLGLICLGIGAVFASLGFWPVLPFAGLEWVAVGAALFVVTRRNRYREVMQFEGGRFRVEFGVVGEGVRASHEWPRSRTRTWLERDGRGDVHLVLACGAEQVRVGECLTEAERVSLMRRLKELILAGLQAGFKESDAC
jgi:uncharacterized membrane protein